MEKLKSKRVRICGMQDTEWRKALLALDGDFDTSYGYEGV